MKDKIIDLKKGLTLENIKNFDYFNFLYKYGTLLVTLIAIMYFSFKLPNFFSILNIMNILRSIAIVSLMAIGITISLTVNGFDLSVGAVAGFAAVIAAKVLIIWEFGTVFAILLPLLAGVAVGLVNAFLIVKIKITDMLTTLSMMFIVTGVLITFTGGSSIYNYMPLPNNGGIAPGLMTDAFLFIGQGKVWGIPFPVFIMAFTVLIVHIFLTKTKYGRYLYMTGGNKEAAMLSGVPVNKYRVLAYVLSAFFAALAGVVLASRLGSGEVNSGSPYLMDSVAAAYIGFSVLGIGKPNVFGTIIGSILMGVLLNGLIMMDFPYYSQDIIKGLVLVLALGLTYYRKRG